MGAEAKAKPAEKTPNEKAAIYMDLKEKIAVLGAEQDVLKEDLKNIARDAGALVPNGHKVLMTGDYKLILEKRLSAKIDAEKAEPILKAKGLWSKVTKTITVIDEDKIEDAVNSGKLSKAEARKFIVSKEIEALKVEVV